MAPASSMLRPLGWRILVQLLLMLAAAWAWGAHSTSSPRPTLQGLDVAVVGGGVAGLASALALRRIAGASVSVYQPDLVGRTSSGFGVTLWPNGMRALRLIDEELHDELVRHCSVVHERMFTTIDNTEVVFCDEREQFGHPMLCARMLFLHDALRRRAMRHGVRFVPGVECCGVKVLDGARGVELSLREAMEEGEEEEEGEEQVVTAGLAVGADGLHSVVRKHLGDMDEPRDTGSVWFVGIAQHAVCPVLDRERVHQFLLENPTKSVTLMPVGGSHTYWAVTMSGPDQEEALRLPEEDMKNFLIQHFRECDAVVPLIKATPPEQMTRKKIQDRPALESFIMGAQGADSSHDDDDPRVVLVGDAAHPMRPAMCQGANVALEDAAQLALLIRDAGSVGEALRAYDEARVLRCATIQGDSEFVARKRRPPEGAGGGGDLPGQGGSGVKRESPPNAVGRDHVWLFNWEPRRLREPPRAAGNHAAPPGVPGASASA